VCDSLYKTHYFCKSKDFCEAKGLILLRWRQWKKSLYAHVAEKRQFYHYVFDCVHGWSNEAEINEEVGVN